MLLSAPRKIYPDFIPAKCIYAIKWRIGHSCGISWSAHNDNVTGFLSVFPCTWIARHSTSPSRITDTSFTVSSVLSSTTSSDRRKSLIDSKTMTYNLISSTILLLSRIFRRFKTSNGVNAQSPPAIYPEASFRDLAIMSLTKAVLQGFPFRQILGFDGWIQHPWRFTFMLRHRTHRSWNSPMCPREAWIAPKADKHWSTLRGSLQPPMHKTGLFMTSRHCSSESRRKNGPPALPRLNRMKSAIVLGFIAGQNGSAGWSSRRSRLS